MNSNGQNFRLALPMLALLLPVSAWMPGYAHAKYMMPHLQDVPIKRLLTNLEEQVRKKPDDARLRLNQARAYAMAYALNSGEAQITINTDDGKLGLWRAPFSRDPLMPQSVAKIPGDAARNHLQKAIEVYETTLRNAEKEPFISQIARLGYGWCLEQSGNKKRAVSEYRILVSQARDGRASSSSNEPAFGRSWSDASVEAADYLLALLDQQQDAAEIAKLREQLKQSGLRPMTITPIAIPLKADTPLSEIEDANAQVAFDVDGRGMGQHWSWITPKAGWLAYDPKQTGKISSGIRLFGSVSYWMFWQNGYQPLSALDDNSDGILSGQELAGIVVWVDENRDGVSNSKEIKPLAELNIKALRYAHSELAGHPDHIAFSPNGVEFDDGSNSPSYDIILHRKP